MSPQPSKCPSTAWLHAHAHITVLDPLQRTRSTRGKGVGCGQGVGDGHPRALEGRDLSASRPGFGSLRAALAWFPGPPSLPGRPRSQVFLLAVLGVCGCCGALRPRYKRLVDNIFPEDPEVGRTSARHHLPPSHPVQGGKGKAGLPGPSPVGPLRLRSVGRGSQGPAGCGDLDLSGVRTCRGLGKLVWAHCGPLPYHCDIFLPCVSLSDGS